MTARRSAFLRSSTGISWPFKYFSKRSSSVSAIFSIKSARYFSTSALKSSGIGTSSNSLPVPSALISQTVWDIKAEGTGKEFDEVPIPEDLRADVEKYRADLIEKIAETDDDLLEKYLKGQEIPVNDLKKALRRAVINYQIVPVLAGSSLRNKGVQPLLDAVVEYLPSPLDIATIKGI